MARFWIWVRSQETIYLCAKFHSFSIRLKYRNQNGMCHLCERCESYLNRPPYALSKHICNCCCVFWRMKTKNVSERMLQRSARTKTAKTAEKIVVRNSQLNRGLMEIWRVIEFIGHFSYTFRRHYAAIQTRMETFSFCTWNEPLKCRTRTFEWRSMYNWMCVDLQSNKNDYKGIEKCSKMNFWSEIYPHTHTQKS